MRPRHCEEGEALETAYMKTTLLWINAETRKRMAVPVSMSVKTAQWHEIARNAAHARSDHDHALWTYINHVIACSECHPANAATGLETDGRDILDATALPDIASAGTHRGAD